MTTKTEATTTKRVSLNLSLGQLLVAHAVNHPEVESNIFTQTRYKLENLQYSSFVRLHRSDMELLVTMQIKIYIQNV